MKARRRGRFRYLLRRADDAYRPKGFRPSFRSRGALAEAAGELPSMSSMPEALAEHHFLQEFGTNLMAEPARTAVDGHDDVVKRKLERFSVMASKISVTTWTSR
jgi:hypothetical protein